LVPIASHRKRRPPPQPSPPRASRAGGGRCEHFATVPKVIPESFTPFDTRATLRSRSLPPHRIIVTASRADGRGVSRTSRAWSGMRWSLAVFRARKLVKAWFCPPRPTRADVGLQAIGPFSAPRAQVSRARKLANRKVGPLRGSNSRGAASPLGDRVRSAGEGCIRGNTQLYSGAPEMVHRAAGAC